MKPVLGNKEHLRANGRGAEPAPAHLGRVTELCRLSYEYPSFCAKQEPQTSILEC
jgi:hypothetical protein